MRRLIIAIVLMTLLIVSCFAGYAALDSLSTEAARRVSVADTLVSAEDFPGANTALRDAYTFWRSKQPMLGAVVRHNELDDIENLFQRAMQSLEDRQVIEYRLHARELQSMLLHVPEMERPTIQNVF